MPWCDTCDKFYNPNSMAPDGTCMKCGSFIAKPEEEADRSTRAPWHFWVLVLALVIYLGYRLIQGIAWVAHKL